MDRAGHLARCNDCGLVQRWPIAGEDDVAKVYARATEDTLNYEPGKHRAWDAAREALLRYPVSPGRTLAILDIGCNRGDFLGSLPTQWRRFGVEMSAEPGRVATEMHDVKIVSSQLDNLGSTLDGQFDAVTMFDVLEHLRDPMSAIEQSAKLLRPGGILLISTANFGHWTWRWSLGNHWYLQTPHHISVATRKLFRVAARRSGLQLERTRKISHLPSSIWQRLRQSVLAVHSGCVGRPEKSRRLVQRLVRQIPGFGFLRHRNSIDWTMELRDHVLIHYGRKGTNYPAGTPSPASDAPLPEHD